MTRKRTPIKLVTRVQADTPSLALKKLKAEQGATGIKLSTEDSAMSHAQIEDWVAMAKGILPVHVKIGGPNARNDIKNILPMDIDGLIGPMIESPYALENFICAVRDFSSPLQYRRIKKCMNLETAFAVKHLDEILDSSFAKEIDEVTLGSSDLLQSLGAKRSDAKFMDLIRTTLLRVKEKGYSVSLGGGIQPTTIDELLKETQPSRFNTRILGFSCDGRESFKPAVTEALRFELLMLENDLKKGYLSLDEEHCRALEIKKRLDG